MGLQQKLRELKRASQPRDRDQALERTLAYLRRLEGPPAPKKLPAQRTGRGIETYVNGEVVKTLAGDFFLARETLPFGRPYGKIRIGDIAAANLASLNLFLPNAALPEPSRLVFLDTETTGLVGGTGTCAFLIGIGAVEGLSFVIRQFFLRDYPEEKALLAALAEALRPYDGIVTFNGKTFDIPLLDTRYTLARRKSPFERLLHLDLLHPARRLWKLRLESCKLTDLESAVLGIQREGDVPGSDIPGIYFDYLRTGDAIGLQPVFYHNALDILTLAALTAEMARLLGNAGALESPLDLFSLSRIYGMAGARDESVSTCQRALASGLPQAVETQALRHLALQLKRQRRHELAVEAWLELTRRDLPAAFEAWEELAIYYEHRRRDPATAIEFTLTALDRLRESAAQAPQSARFVHRLERLRKKASRPGRDSHLPLT